MPQPESDRFRFGIRIPGGSGSVVGDTTTTMMWIDGVSPLDVFHGYVERTKPLREARTHPSSHVEEYAEARRERLGFEPVTDDSGALFTITRP